MSINSNLRELNNKSNFLGPRYQYAIWSKKYFVLVKEKKLFWQRGLSRVLHNECVLFYVVIVIIL